MLDEILLSDDIVQIINNNINYMLEIIPEIKPMIGFEHNNPEHHLDVWEHTLFALSLSPPNYDIRLVLLLHDIGKPYSYQDGEIRHFKGHAAMSAAISRKILKRFNYPDSYIEKLCYLIRNHDYPISDTQILTNYDLALKLYEIQRCDALAHHPDRLEKRKQYLKKIEEKF